MTISRATEYLETMYGALNNHYFESALPPVMLTLQSSSKTYGHFTLAKIWKDGDDNKNEINISAEYLNRPIENLAATLIHEMVHFYCYMNGIKDTSRGFTYHNARFKAEAERRDLIIGYDKRIGFSMTSPSQALVDFVRAQGWSSVELHRLSGETSSWGDQGDQDGKNGADGDGGARKKSNVRKYSCPVCKNSVRATKTVHIGCLDCGCAMELVDVG